MDAHSRPTALLTNDDGISSHFLWRLVHALDQYFDVTVVAPDGERSWAGRSFTRTGNIDVKASPDRPKTWSISGSPTDCVNLGMHHLMPTAPDVVVSGINLGFNMSLPLVLTSGTVSAALEGALNGVHAVASSMHIPSDAFEETKASHGRVTGALDQSLMQAAEHTAKYAHQLVGKPFTDTVVHNLNFPATTSENTPLEEVCLSNLRLGSMYQPVASNTFQFRFPEKRQTLRMPENGDLEALNRGHASIALLNYDSLCP